MKIKSVKFNFIMNFILTASNFIFPLITFPYVSRVLGASGTGKVSFAISVVSYFTMVAALGIPTYGIRTTAKVRDDQEKLNRTTQEILSIHLFMMLLVSIVYILAILFVPRFQSDRTLFLVVGVSILLDPLGVNWLYQGLEQYGYIAKRSIFLKFVGVILMFMFIHSPDDYVFYGVTSILASVGSNVLNFINLRKYVSLKLVGNYDIKQHLKPILILFAQVIAVNIYTNLDNVMLGFMKTDVDVGLYAAAVKVKTEAEEQLGVFGLVQILLQKTSDYARQQVKVRIEDIVSEALNVVFGGNHKFMIDLTLRGNQPIAEYYLNDDSVITKLEKPDYDRGGGKIDIIALALRLAVGEMEGVDGPLFLDEVGKHVSKEYAPSVAYFLKEYSATFGRQIILITHNADLAEIGEVSLAVKRSQSGESEVSVL